MAAAASVIDYLFQRSLDDLIKGLRSHAAAATESRYVAKALEEVRKEIKSTDAHTKAVAIQKLTYLHMLHGSDMSWASFHIVEVMSMPKFSHKKIGYLAASQSFTEATDVLLLITNLLKKDLASKNEYEAGLALECLSRIATADLARDLTMDVFTMLGSSKVHVRKKATLVLLKVFSKYPDAIRVAFKRLVEKLEDPETQVVSACVSVLHELARQDPHPYLPLAPELYRLLVESTNNWLCIKVVKLFALLMPLEPRLSKKICDPLCQQMRRSNAKSLIFECIRTVTTGLMEQPEAVQLASEKLKEILNDEDEDPNLKYLGLQSLLEFLPRHPSLVSENKSVIVKCLNDGDPSVQMGSLRLIVGMVSDSNIAETVQILIRYARSAEKSFCNELISAILSTCSRAFYELVGDFSWYVGVLGELVRIPHFEQAEEVERQLVDIGFRVESVRKELFKLARGFLVDSWLWENNRVHRVLAAAAWIVGEYAEYATDLFEIVEALLQPRFRKLPGSVQSVYTQAVMKVLVYFVNHEQQQQQQQQVNGEPVVVNTFEYTEIEPAQVEDEAKNLQHEDGLKRLLVLIKENAGFLKSHVDTEVQERASNLFGLIDFLEDGSFSPTGFAAVSQLFALELGPVSQFAQQRVPVPEGLELLDDLGKLKKLIGEDNLMTTTLPDSSSLFVRKKDSEESRINETAGLLAKHRQENEKYYLPKESRQAAEVEEFPRAEVAQEEPKTRAEDNWKIAEESLIWNKPRRPKARSVVVKLMDEETPFDNKLAGSTVKARKDSVLSSAIRDVLSTGGKSKNHVAVGEQVASTSHHHHHHHRASPRKHKKEKQAAEETSEMLPVSQQHQIEENLVPDEQREQRRSKKHHRRRAKSPLKVVPQTSVVPDFLL